MFADPSEILFLEECCKFTLDPAKYVNATIILELIK